jgi:hypothetical protein
VRSRQAHDLNMRPDKSQIDGQGRNRKGQDMKLSDAFPSNLLKVEHLKGKRVNLTIKDISLEKIGTDQKLATSFKETDKQLVLNKTNSNMLAMLTGSDDTDDWTGLKITLRPDMTQYQGKPTPCIRIDSELPEQNKKPTPIKQADSSPLAEVSDDEIPF